MIQLEDQSSNKPNAATQSGSPGKLDEELAWRQLTSTTRVRRPAFFAGPIAKAVCRCAPTPAFLRVQKAHGQRAFAHVSVANPKSQNVPRR
jgi:hypothetical protein